jgi:hypothetical protein
MANGVKWVEHGTGTVWSISANTPWLVNSTVGHVYYDHTAVGRKYIAMYYYPVNDQKKTQYTERFHELEEAQSWLTALVRMA